MLELQPVLFLELAQQAICTVKLRHSKLCAGSACTAGDQAHVECGQTRGRSPSHGRCAIQATFTGSTTAILEVRRSLRFRSPADDLVVPLVLPWPMCQADGRRYIAEWKWGSCCHFARCLSRIGHQV